MLSEVIMRVTGNCSSCSVRATSFSWFSRVGIEAANAVMSLASASAVFWVTARIEIRIECIIHKTQQ